MADQNVKIHVGSTYDGSGLTRMSKGVSTMSSQARKAAGAVGQIAGAFGQLEGTAAKSVGAIAGSLGALASGGIIGAITFSIAALVGWIQKLGAENDPIKKFKTTLESIKDTTGTITSDLASGLSKIDKYATSINKLKDAYARLADAEAAAKKIKIENDIENLPNGGTGEEVANQIMQRAELEREKTFIDTDTAKNKADAQVNKAKGNLETASKKLNLMKDSVDRLKKSLDIYDDKLVEANRILYARQERGASADDIAEAKKSRNEILKARNEFVAKTYNPAIVQKNLAESEVDSAKVEIQVAQQERENVLAENAKKIAMADRKYQQATVMAANAREKEAREADEQLALQNARAANEQRKEQLQKELDNATEELITAQMDYANKLRNANVASAAYNDMMNGNGGRWGNGGNGVINPNGARPGRTRRGAAANNTDNTGNWNVFAEPEGREQRYWQTHQDEAIAKGVVPGLTAEQEKDKAKLIDKMAEGGYENLSDKDKAEWDRIKALDPELQAEEAEKRANEAKNNLDTMKTKVDNIATSLSNIDNWLKEHDGAK